MYENDHLIVIKDILPKAPVHFLVIPKKHIKSITDLAVEDEALVGEMIIAAKDVAAKQGIAGTGYKIVFNVGKDGGQIIAHLHMHVLGGKQLAD